MDLGALISNATLTNLIMNTDILTYESQKEGVTKVHIFLHIYKEYMAFSMVFIALNNDQRHHVPKKLILKVQFFNK